MNGHLGFYRGRSLVSWCIKWFTRSEYSHVAYIDEMGRVYEAWSPKIRVMPSIHQGHTPGTIIDLFRFELTLDQEAEFVQYLLSRIDKQYDMRGVLGFISRRAGAQREDRDFCSELILDASRAAGVPLLRLVPSYAVSPGHLSSSPLLWSCGQVVT